MKRCRVRLFSFLFFFLRVREFGLRTAVHTRSRENREYKIRTSNKLLGMCFEKQCRCADAVFEGAKIVCACVL